MKRNEQNVQVNEMKTLTKSLSFKRVYHGNKYRSVTRQILGKVTNYG